MNPTEILKKYWGFDKFRLLQGEIIDAILNGHDTLGLMPTGGGKSIAFQVPGLCLGGLTIVVTPLISLMKDQVDNLRQRRVKAVYFHSAMTSKEIRTAWERLTNDGCNFLYLAPERLSNDRFMAELSHLPINLIVVDEAHCISQWGYDFRPSYLNIKRLRKIAPKASMVALTATATSQVSQDICKELDFRDGFQVVKASFARDNISYLVRPTELKIQETIHILTHTQGSAIIYVRNRKKTRQIAEALTAEGLTATWYHAGLTFEVKEERQNAWKSGKIRVMVATNAFGMGIDKADVRVVIHYDHPSSLEEYYQEAGRVGRDGSVSYAILLRGKRDKATLHRHITEAFPSREYIRKVYDRLCIFFNLEIGEGYRLLRQFDLQKFCTVFKLDEEQCMAALKILTRSALIEYIEEKETLSRLMILTDREELYHAGIDANADKVLTSIMRQYPGLFSDFVFIFESRIAADTGLTEAEVCDSLIELSKRKLLSYIPRTRTPYIYFPTAREDADYIMIPHTVYEQRKDALTKRINAMIDYSYSSTKCRVSRMLKYFGETNPTECRKCDVCRSQKLQPPERQSIAKKVDHYIATHPNGFPIKAFKNSFGSQATEAFRWLQYLVDEKMINVDETGYYFSNENGQ